MVSKPIDETIRQDHLWCDLLHETIIEDSNLYDYVTSVAKTDEKYRNINPLGFDLSGIPGVAHLGVLRGLAKVVEECQKYADCEVNGRSHLWCAVTLAVLREVAIAVTDESVVEETMQWLHTNHQEITTYHSWAEKSTKIIPAWTDPCRTFTEVIVAHYRPESK